MSHLPQPIATACCPLHGNPVLFLSSISAYTGIEFRLCCYWNVSKNLTIVVGNNTMAALAAHVNVWETCLQLLERKGFVLRVELDEGEGYSQWYGERDGFDFVAGNPIELRGLVVVFEDIQPERHQPYWWSASTDESIRVSDRLACDAETREAMALKWQERPEWARRVREAWENSEHDVKDTADALGFCTRVIRPLLVDMELLADRE
jgi:hypothetical protein